jgi:ribonuclease HI
VPDGPYASGAEDRSTNQRMEVTAVLRALEALQGPLLVMSDSTYVVNCFRDRWWEGWRRRGWRNSAGKPVANRDLWEVLLALGLDGDRPVTFSWVKGHSGDEMNDRVDMLALEAASAQQGVSGERFTM